MEVKVKSKKVIWSVVIIILILIIAVSFMMRKKGEVKKLSDVKFTVNVKQVEIGDIDEYISLSGNIMALSTVNVISKVPGKIERIYVSEGDRIRKDQLLAKIDDDDIQIQLKQAIAGYESAKVRAKQARLTSEKSILTQLKQAQAMLSSNDARFKQMKEGARPEEKDQINSMLEQAKANFENTENNYERMKKLFDSGSVSQQQFDIAKTQYLVAKAQYESSKKQKEIVDKGAREGDITAMEKSVEQAQASLDMINNLYNNKSWENDIALADAGVIQAKAAKDMAENQLANTVIKSPVNGIVTKKFVDENNMCSPQTPILTVVEMDEVKVVVNCSEQSLSELKEGLTTKIELDAYAGEEFSGRIFKIGQTVDLLSRTVAVEIRIPNANHRIKPGMFARVKVFIAKKKNVLTLPKEGILEEETGDYTIVVKNGVTEKRKVQTGLNDGIKVEIVKGLKDGETVVTEGNYGLKSGISVNVNK